MGLIIPPRAAALLGDNAEKYRARVLRDFETIKPWLPKSVSRIVDIGCGLAGVDVHLARETKARSVVLIDGDGTGSRKMGFVDNTRAWSDVEIGAELVEANLPGISIYGFAEGNIKKSTWLWCDLLISLKSWCHHYPAETYLGLVQRSLEFHGRMILDIRTGTNGLAVLEAGGFRSIGIAYSTAKADRHVFERIA